MPDIIPLQDEIVYGPIRSRRLGSSLGINVLPLGHKACSSNCVYCQYGWTLPGPFTERLKRAPELLPEIEAAFRQHAHQGTPVDSITLAGNGEPTLHPDLDALIVGLTRLRDTYFPSAAVSILSDSTQLVRPRVREALARLDVRYLKFDAGDAATWQAINKPLSQLTFQDMVDAMKLVPDIVLQSMFIRGAYDNTQPAHLRAWIRQVGDIRPRLVHVYTVDRGTAAPGIEDVPREQLEAIASALTGGTGIPADVFD